jgi:hypothetical protein
MNVLYRYKQEIAKVAILTNYCLLNFQFSTLISTRAEMQGNISGQFWRKCNFQIIFLFHLFWMKMWWICCYHIMRNFYFRVWIKYTDNFLYLICRNCWESTSISKLCFNPQSSPTHTNFICSFKTNYLNLSIIFQRLVNTANQHYQSRRSFSQGFMFENVDLSCQCGARILSLFGVIKFSTLKWILCY